MSAAALAHDAHHDDSIPPDQYMGEATPGKIGMWVLLLSDAFSFFGLLLAYGICRGGSSEWYADYLPTLGINFTAGMTFLLICSSVTMVLAHSACVAGDRKATARFLALTVLGGALFLCGQVYEYQHLIGTGFVFGEPLVGESRYASTFYMITSFHGLHVFTGVTFLTVMLINTLRGKYDGGKHNMIEIAGLFWHFVDLVWILVFTFVYLVPE
jgi:heme/copper-type cytochrome/quinol oxidase subunit 3